MLNRVELPSKRVLIRIQPKNEPDFGSSCIQLVLRVKSSDEFGFCWTGSFGFTTLNFTLIVRGHSTTTWTQFYPILTPIPLEWTKMDILHTIYPLTRDLHGLSNDPPNPLFVHVFIECPLGEAAAA